MMIKTTLLVTGGYGFIRSHLVEALVIGTGKVNHEGTLNVLKDTRQHGVRRVVLVGSASTYGDKSTLPKIESMPANPIVEVTQ
jgi:nucleoside-diphosphate-sugar epimerase